MLSTAVPALSTQEPLRDYKGYRMAGAQLAPNVTRERHLNLSAVLIPGVSLRNRALDRQREIVSRSNPGYFLENR